MIDVNEYILLTKAERQAHLDLNRPCLERGGNSTNHKGVLAQFLDTTIPSGRICLCHACHNSGCSNPLHLYWGTDSENFQDFQAVCKEPADIWSRTVKKYGEEEARQMLKSRDKTSGGKGNKGILKSPEHKRKISQGVKESWAMS